MLDLEAIKKRIAAATPGPWERDKTANEGSYGDGGPDCREGYYSYEILAEVNGKSVTLCDSINATHQMVEEEFDGDENGSWVNAWDEIGRRNFDLIANAPTDLAALVAEVERLQGERERYAQLAENAMTKFLFTGAEREAYREGCRMAAKAIRES